MRYPKILWLFALCVWPGFVDAAEVKPLSVSSQVERWGLFELALSGPTEGNPFVDVRLTGVFTNGQETIEVPGFYDGAGVYRIRFMPSHAGVWRYTTRSNRWPLTHQSGAFEATAATGKNHGPVRVHNTYHFAYADGTPFWQIGTTCYSWTHRPAEIEEQTLKTLAGAPFNKLRMCVFPQTHGSDFMPPTRWPFEGTPPKQWDYSRFSPEFFQHLEQRIGQLRDLGIECDLILFHPYGPEWGFDAMDAATDDRYLRYVVARLGAYRNIWWSIANEYDFVRTKTTADWDRDFQTVEQADPYHHLRSIHNGDVFYDHNKPWVTHVSVQKGPALEEPGRAELLREVYRKPIVFDEVRYEGDHEMRWANLSGREMVHRFWVATVAGTYAGHSEYFQAPHDVVWLGQGGLLKGESPARLAFLRKILEEAPPGGLDQIDHWQEARPPAAGRPGKYYLIYFGRTTPNEWTFQLYKNGLTDGMEFAVEVIDTWAMTITPVPGVFVTKKKDRYDYVDRDGRSVTLPAKPGVALRVRWVGGVPAQPDASVLAIP
ncbi:MAG: DUF5060 domain-containing protein [Opitutus sp.]